MRWTEDRVRGGRDPVESCLVTDHMVRFGEGAVRC